jgi:hypothetical protein
LAGALPPQAETAVMARSAPSRALAASGLDAERDRSALGIAENICNHLELYILPLPACEASPSSHGASDESEGKTFLQHEEAPEW